MICMHPPLQHLFSEVLTLHFHTRNTFPQFNPQNITTFCSKAIFSEMSEFNQFKPELPNLAVASAPT